MVAALKCCPFCGGEATLNSYHSCDCCGKAYNGRVSCAVCAAEISHCDTDDEAIECWNRRIDAALALPIPGGENTEGEKP